MKTELQLISTSAFNKAYNLSYGSKAKINEVSISPIKHIFHISRDRDNLCQTDIYDYQFILW